jgi:hypothetical protein
VTARARARGGGGIVQRVFDADWDSAYACALAQPACTPE